ncbi:MAG: FCD domain-containing protein, partial [Burkholderiales bacterium]|nr:FCD domain-containing protein [Burkholderiales bacterium]
ERGLDEAVRARLLECLAAGDAVLAKGHLVEDDIGPWSRLNAAFHQTIVDATGSRVIGEAIARNNHLPFASSDSIVIDTGALEKEYEKLRLAQLHHRLVVEALEGRESARVEALMREHAHIGTRYGRLFGLEP